MTTFEPASVEPPDESWRALPTLTFVAAPDPQYEVGQRIPVMTKAGELITFVVIEDVLDDGTIRIRPESPRRIES